MPEETLKVYTNGPDKVVAFSKLQATDLLTEYATEDFEDEDMPVDEVPDDQIVTIFFEDDPEDYPVGYQFIEGNRNRVRATAASWAKWNGVGFLATINY